MSTVIHYPNGSTQTLQTDDYMLVVDALDENVKVVDTWQKDGDTHFEIAEKTADDYLTTDEE